MYTENNIVDQVDKNKKFPDIFFLTYGLWNMWYGNKRDSCAFEKNVSKWLMELRDKEGVNVNKKIVWITLPHVIRHPKIKDNMVQYRNNCARKIYNENGLRLKEFDFMKNISGKRDGVHLNAQQIHQVRNAIVTFAIKQCNND